MANSLFNGMSLGQPSGCMMCDPAARTTRICDKHSAYLSRYFREHSTNKPQEITMPHQTKGASPQCTCPMEGTLDHRADCPRCTCTPKGNYHDNNCATRFEAPAPGVKVVLDAAVHRVVSLRCNLCDLSTGHLVGCGMLPRTSDPAGSYRLYVGEGDGKRKSWPIPPTKDALCYVVFRPKGDGHEECDMQSNVVDGNSIVTCATANEDISVIALMHKLNSQSITVDNAACATSDFTPDYEMAFVDAIDRFQGLFATATPRQLRGVIDLFGVRTKGMDPGDVVRRLEHAFSHAGDTHETVKEVEPTMLDNFIEKLRSILALDPDSGLNLGLAASMLDSKSGEDLTHALSKVLTQTREPGKASFERLLKDYVEATNEESRAREKRMRAEASLPSAAYDALRAHYAESGEQAVIVLMKGVHRHGPMSNEEARKYLEAVMVRAHEVGYVPTLPKGMLVKHFRIIASADASRG